MNSSKLLLLFVFFSILVGVGYSTSTPVTSCENINSSGVYLLSNDLVSLDGSSCIVINVSDVVLDLNGYSIYGAASSTDASVYVYSHYIQLTNITIANGTVNNSNSGIYMRGVSNSTIRNVTSYDNYDGLYIWDSYNNTLTNNTIYNNLGDNGIYLYGSSNNYMTNNIIHNNHHGLFLTWGSNNNNLANNTVYSNHYGFSLTVYSNNNNITNNSVYSNYDGFYLYSSNNNNIANNTIYNNNEYGFYLESSSGNTLINNTIQNNTERDIYFQMSAGTNCNNIIEDNNGSGGYPIKFFNYSVNLHNEILSELILCNADYSNISNITVKGLDTLHNNGLFVGFSDYSNFTDINSSNNYGGLYLYESSNNNITNSIANNILPNGIASNDGGWGFLLSSHSNNNILINNTAFNNARGGFDLGSSSNNTLTSNNAYDNHESGFSLGSSSYNNLNSNNASNNGGTGFYLSYTHDTNFTNNTAYNDSNGFHLHISCDSNTIINNKIYDSRENGFFLQYSSSNVITNNTIYNSTQNGFYLGSVSYNILANNTVYSNHGDGFYLYTPSYNKLINNIVYNNTNGFYLYSYSHDNNLTLNNVYNNSNDGFYLGYHSHDYTLTSNNAYNNLEYGFYLDSSSDNTLILNNVSNETIGFCLNSSSNNVNISGLTAYNVSYGIYVNNLDNLSVSGAPENYITLENITNGIYLDNVTNSHIGYVNVTENNRNYSLVVYLSGQYSHDISFDHIYSINSSTAYGIFVDSGIDNISINKSKFYGMDSGVYIDDGSNYNISNTQFNNDYVGLYDANIQNLTMDNNSFNNNFNSLYMPQVYPDYKIYTNNTIDGKPIYYVINGKVGSDSGDTFYADDLITPTSNGTIYNVSMLILYNTTNNLNFTDPSATMDLRYTSPSIYIYNVSNLTIDSNTTYIGSSYNLIISNMSNNISLSNIYMGSENYTMPLYTPLLSGSSGIHGLEYLYKIVSSNSNITLHNMTVYGDLANLIYYGSVLNNTYLNVSEVNVQTKLSSNISFTYMMFLIFGNSSLNQTISLTDITITKDNGMNSSPSVSPDGRPLRWNYMNTLHGSRSNSIVHLSRFYFFDVPIVDMTDITLDNFKFGIFDGPTFSSQTYSGPTSYLNISNIHFNDPNVTVDGTNRTSYFALQNISLNATDVHTSQSGESLSSEFNINGNGTFSIYPFNSSELDSYKTTLSSSLDLLTLPFGIDNSTNVDVGGAAKINLTLLYPLSSSYTVTNQEIYQRHSESTSWVNITNSTGTTNKYYFARADNITSFSAFAMFGQLSSTTQSNNEKKISASKTLSVSPNYNCSTGNLTVTVKDYSDGTPVKDARVSLISEKSSYTTYQFTDSQGKVAFENIYYGNTTLEVTFTGYANYYEHHLPFTECPSPTCDEGYVLKDGECVKVGINNSENTNQSECISNNDCLSTEYCSGGACTEVIGTCGYVKNHEWVSYECCNDSKCDITQKCVNHQCTNIKYSMNTPKNVMVGQDVTAKITANTNPAPGVKVTMKSPSGKIVNTITNKNGELKFNALEDGEYTLKATVGNETVAERTVLVEKNKVIISDEDSLLSLLKKNLIWIVMGTVVILGGAFYYLKGRGSGVKKIGKRVK